MKSIQLKVNKPIPGYAPRRIVTVRVDSNGTPLQKFWRDRLRDADVDSCVEIVKDKPKTQTKKESPKEDS